MFCLIVCFLFDNKKQQSSISLEGLLSLNCLHHDTYIWNGRQLHSVLMSLCIGCFTFVGPCYCISLRTRDTYLAVECIGYFTRFHMGDPYFGFKDPQTTLLVIGNTSRCLVHKICVVDSALEDALFLPYSYELFYSDNVRVSLCIHFLLLCPRGICPYCFAHVGPQTLSTHLSWAAE